MGSESTYRCLGALGSLHTSIPAEGSADVCCIPLTGAQTGVPNWVWGLPAFLLTRHCGLLLAAG